MIDLKNLVSLCKRRGFVFQGSEIYGGLANTWDYGPLGILLKKNIKDTFWNRFIVQREDIFPIESAILMNSKVWEASGHLDNFSDPLIDCKKCRERFRADQLLEEKLGHSVTVAKISDYTPLLKEHGIVCPSCGSSDFTDVRNFNLMFKTFAGVVEGKGNEIFLRPETAQGIFVNFLNILNSMRPKLPFGIAQIGKSFRNEITPGNFIFRTREFEQMEIEYFVYPGKEMEHFDIWVNDLMNFLLDLGLKKENLRIRDHAKEELSHYSNRTADIEFQYPWGWGELMGIASRTDFDLSRHIETSKVDLKYFDPVENKHLVPYVIEPSLGLDRLLLCILFQSYEEEMLKDNENRIVMRFVNSLAPIKAAILPLKKNEPRIVEIARRIFKMLSQHYSIAYDDTGSIGKLYRRQDEIGTPFCITVDFQTIDDETVTIRDRDTMKQERISINTLLDFFKNNIK